MTNGLDTVQGGVILSGAAAVAEQVARSDHDGHTDHFLLDISLDIMKSPTSNAETDYHWESLVARRGRRLTVVVSELRDSRGRLYAHSSATSVSQTPS
ncbi:hypothetical protein ACWDTI_10360 [Gordonia sp. NPDC003424]